MLQAKVRYEVGMDLARPKDSTSTVSVARILQDGSIQIIGFKKLDSRNWIQEIGGEGMSAARVF